jgi:hypothetical protein
MANVEEGREAEMARKDRSAEGERSNRMIADCVGLAEIEKGKLKLCVFLKMWLSVAQ